MNSSVKLQVVQLGLLVPGARVNGGKQSDLDVTENREPKTKKKSRLNKKSSGLGQVGKMFDELPD